MNEFNLNFIIVRVLIIINIAVHSILSNAKQLIHIESNTQILNIQSNIITFIGNVVVTIGKIKINADKIIITNLGNKYDKAIIDGYGNPVVICQISDKDKFIKGEALQIHYERANGLLVLSGKAYLEQLTSNITGDKIKYLVKDQKIEAFSGQGKRVTMVLSLS